MFSNVSKLDASVLLIPASVQHLDGMLDKVLKIIYDGCSAQSTGNLTFHCFLSNETYKRNERI